MRKTQLPKQILESLLDGKKSIYDIFKYAKNNSFNLTYPPVLRMVKKLEKEKLIEENKANGNNPRNAKFYEITVKGLATLYFIRKKEDNKNDLDFHHSQQAKEIIKKLIEKISKDMNFRTKEIKTFSKVAYASPSLIEYFISYESNEFYALPLKATNFLDEIYLKSDESSKYPIEKLLCIDKIENDCQFYWKFYLEILPLTVLAKDFIKYRDNEIGYLLFERLVKESERRGKEFQKWEKFTFKNVISAVKKGLIDPNGSVEEQYSKYLNISRGKGKREIRCPEHWKLYIPPFGKPILACEGCRYMKEGAEKQK